MRSAIFAVSLSALCFVAAWAEDDAMAPRYGNTTITTEADGSLTKFYYRADHTFTFKHVDFKTDGKWEIKDGKLCRTYDTAAPGRTNPDCGAADMRKVGDSWTTKSGAKATLVQGIQ